MLSIHKFKILKAHIWWELNFAEMLIVNLEEIVFCSEIEK